MQIIYHYHNVSPDYLSGLDWTGILWLSKRLYLLLATGSGRPKLNWIWDMDIFENINLPISNSIVDITFFTLHYVFLMRTPTGLNNVDILFAHTHSDFPCPPVPWPLNRRCPPTSDYWRRPWC